MRIENSCNFSTFSVPESSLKISLSFTFCTNKSSKPLWTHKPLILLLRFFLWYCRWFIIFYNHWLFFFFNFCLFIVIIFVLFSYSRLGTAYVGLCSQSMIWMLCFWKAAFNGIEVNEYSDGDRDLLTAEK